MKRDLRICILILAPFFLVLLVVTYFIRWAPPKATGLTVQEISGYEGLSLSVREDSVSSGGATVEILNESGEEIALESNFFQIHVKTQGQWHNVQFTKAMAFTGMSRPVNCPEGEIISITQKWEHWGKLRPGHYRILLTFYNRTTEEDFNSAAEFTVK